MLSMKKIYKGMAMRDPGCDVAALTLVMKQLGVTEVTLKPEEAGDDPFVLMADLVGEDLRLRIVPRSEAMKEAARPSGNSIYHHTDSKGDTTTAVIPRIDPGPPR